MVDGGSPRPVELTMRNPSVSEAGVPAAARLPRQVLAGIPAAALALALLAACDDDPLSVRWVESPDTVRLHALSRTEPNLYSGFDFHPRIPVLIESLATGGNFDLAVDTAGGQFVWLPPGALGVTSSAGIATMEGETFESTVRAPADTAQYATTVPVPLRIRTTYVIRTRGHAGLFGINCNYYGKIEPLAIDVASGQVVFQFDVSPACNNRDLIPPD